MNIGRSLGEQRSGIASSFRHLLFEKEHPNNSALRSRSRCLKEKYCSHILALARLMGSFLLQKLTHCLHNFFSFGNLKTLTPDFGRMVQPKTAHEFLVMVDAKFRSKPHHLNRH